MTQPEDQPIPHEEFLQPAWEEFRTAIKSFGPDYGIVGHPETPSTSPFDAPNGPDSNGHRQYNVTQIPDNMSADEFERRLGWTDTILFACMDKDEIRPTYDKLITEGKKVAVFSMAGGAIHLSDSRREAFETMVAYISQHGGNGKDVIAAGHDMTCGLVKYENGNESLADSLHTEPGSPEEDLAMKQLIVYSVQELKLDQYFSQSKIMLTLLAIDRQGNVQFDTDFTDIQPASLEEIRQST